MGLRDDFVLFEFSLPDFSLFCREKFYSSTGIVTAFLGSVKVRVHDDNDVLVIEGKVSPGEK